MVDLFVRRTKCIRSCVDLVSHKEIAMWLDHLCEIPLIDNCLLPCR
jgi:hypothetical protein